MTQRFAGKVCLVTGAAGGIGAAVARAFADQSAAVVAADIKRPELFDARVCDVSEPESVRDLVDGVARDHGGIDVLFHAAALLGGSGPFLDVSPETFSRMIAVNLTGSFLVAQAVAKRMVAKGTAGRIILVGSVNSFAAEPTAVPYVASKGGVRLLAKAMAVDLARHRITVNMVAPGAITVERNAALFASEPMRRLYDHLIPLGGAGAPADIAHAALFLADAESGYINGAELVVDGGLLAQILPPVPRD